jgi:CzcA family heavy metal efflux pump
MNVVRACRKNSYTVLLLTAFLTVGGLWALFRLPSNIYPRLNFPRIVILAHSGVLSPQTMLVTVTRPLEEAAMTVEGVRRVQSKTIRGASQIFVMFQPGMDMRYALQLMQAQIGAARGALPPDTTVSVDRVMPTVYPVLSFILNGNVPDADLRDDALYVLRPMFTRIPGVGMVEVQGSDVREVSVVVHPQQALSHRLSLVNIADRLRATNDVTSVGWPPLGYRQYLLLSTGKYLDLGQIRDTVVATENGTPIRLGEIADVRFGSEDPRLLVYGNGRPAALLNISRQPGGNILQLAAQAKALAAHLGSAIPKTLHLSVVYDLAEFVQESISNVRDAVLLGAILAVLILFLFLRDARTTLIAATTLPLSVIGAFFFVRMFHGSLNLMSLGGMAIAIGLVIDDAVVIVENIYRHLGLGEGPDLGSENAVRELLAAVVGSTATVLAVFLPLGLLKGVVGEFFSSLCLALGVAVLLSLVYALTVIPLLSVRYLSHQTHQAHAEKLIGPINRVYERMVRWALGHRVLVLAVTVASLALAAFLYTTLKTGFLPRMDEGGYVLDYITPPGTSLDETNRMLHKIEVRIAEMPETAAFSRRTGAEMGLYATEPNTGDILVKLKPASRRSRSTQQVIDAMRAWCDRNVSGVDVEFTQVLQDMIDDMEGTRAPIEVKLFGSDQQELERLAAEIGPRIEAIPGIVDFRGPVRGNPEIVFHVDPVAAGRIGLTVAQVSQQAQAGLFGMTSTQFLQGDHTIGIRVRYPDWFRYNYADILQFPVVGADRQIVPLSAVARVRQIQGETSLKRENERLMVDLTAQLELLDLGSAVRRVQKVMNGVHLPVGYTYVLGGQYESQQNSFHDLLSVLALAIAAVFAVLVIEFRRFGPALIMLSAAPLSLVGVFAMLKVTGTALNVSSFMGIILMVGLVVKNGIILFDYVHKLWEGQGMPLGEALVEAGKIRVRPILMSTLATLFGLLPLSLGIGAGAALQKPLALAVIGGLMVSTFATLLVMPVLYSLFAGETPRKAAP